MATTNKATQSKICPLMSRNNNTKIVYCQESLCAFWITVPTNEGVLHSGCATALQPRMKDGIFIL